MKKIEQAIAGIAPLVSEDQMVVDAIVHVLADMIDKNDGRVLHAITRTDKYRYRLIMTREEA
jgi:hypothetical protein